MARSENHGPDAAGLQAAKTVRTVGITEAVWQADPRGITTGNTGLRLRPRDMAKIGYLALRQGHWNGTQIVAAAWVKASTTKHIETQGLMNAGEDDGDGYLWWIDSWGGYSAHGFGGQWPGDRTFVEQYVPAVLRPASAG